jgi:hypothetical protein
VKESSGASETSICGKPDKLRKFSRKS